MKKRISIRYILLHLILYIIGATALYSVYSIYEYFNSYSPDQKAYVDTYNFHKNYMKYIERLTFFIHYTESGYTVDMSSPTDLEEIIKTEDGLVNKNFKNADEDEQENFEFYNYCLNVQATNFLYYVINTDTGEVYSSPYLKTLYPNDIETFTKNIEKNPAYFILNTKTGKYTTNVNTNYNILTKSDLTWMISTLSSPIVSDDKSTMIENNYLIYTGVVQNFANTGDIFYSDYSEFQTLRSFYNTAIYLLPVSCVLGLLFFLLLLMKNGKQVTGVPETSLRNGIYLNWFDRIATELAALTILATIALCFLTIRQVIFSVLALSSMPTILFLELFYIFLYPICISGVLSLARRIKAKTLWKDSLLYRVSIHLSHKAKEFFKHHNITYRVAVFLLVFIGIQAFGAFLYLTTDSKVLLLGCIGLSYLYLIAFLMKVAIDLGIILDGAKQMQEGDMNLKLPIQELSSSVSELGEYINNISAGLSVAVEERTKSERFKAELITNVSHDIKTPLTSIINYVDLLKKEKIDNPKAQEYLEILTNKSWRLKTLIEDLVEASKASSGAIKMNLQRINLVELLKQAAGEFDDRFHENQLDLIITAPKEPVSIFADGRSTFRIIDNLFSNVNKYAMQGTRVYVDVSCRSGYGVLSVKNISRDKLNITPEELMERFVRADVPRNTEGSGLGLSISRSLTTLQHGTFDLEVDGDLFKAVVTFPLYLDSIA